MTVFIMIFLVGCGISDDKNNLDEQLNEENNTEKQSEEYIPKKALPEGIPVYPGAILTGDIPSVGDGWQWLYKTTGSGNEILEFFIDSFQELGFEIDNDFTTANYEEFFVVTKDNTISVYWLDSDSISDVDEVTPDTPNRHYSIVVDLTKWENR